MLGLLNIIAASFILIIYVSYYKLKLIYASFQETRLVYKDFDLDQEIMIIWKNSSKRFLHFLAEDKIAYSDKIVYHEQDT